MGSMHIGLEEAPQGYERMAAFYAERAKGDVGLIVTGGVSPNDDSRNDTWYLVGMDIQKVKIFNRYGTEVYEQNDYSDQWYGQSKNGKLLPTATYYYYIKFNSGQEKTGWVYLNREVK